MSNPTQTVTRRVDITGKTLLLIVLALAACWLLIKLAPVVLVVVVALFLVGTLNPGCRVARTPAHQPQLGYSTRILDRCCWWARCWLL